MSSENNNESSARSLLQKSLLNATFIVAVLTVSIYLAGRIYTEQYYSQFAVNYRSLDFSTATYMFNGWNVVSTSVLSIILIMVATSWVIDNFYPKDENQNAHSLWTLLNIIACVIIVMFFVVYYPDSAGYSVKDYFLPHDLIVQIVYIVSTSLLLLLSKLKVERGWQKLSDLSKIEGNISISVLIAALFALWLYILGVTAFVAQQHVSRAKNGGMGIKVTQTIEHRTDLASSEKDKSCWWLLLTRTDDGRVLLYRPHESIFVSDEALAMTRDYKDVKPNDGKTIYTCGLPLSAEDTNAESSG